MKNIKKLRKSHDGNLSKIAQTDMTETDKKAHGALKAMMKFSFFF